MVRITISAFPSILFHLEVQGFESSLWKNINKSGKLKLIV